MPRKYSRRRRRRPSNNGGSYLGTASKALAVAYAVKKLINVEYKSINTASPSDPNTTTVVTNLTAIAQGDDFGQRQGRKIRAKYLSYRGQVFQHPTATNSGLRLMIIRDNNGSTTQPTVFDLFNSQAAYFNNLNKIGDPQSNSRFSILYDKYIVFSDVGVTSAHFNMSMSLDHHVFFTGTAATDEGKGAIYLLTASTEATNDPVLESDAQFKWIDN